MFQKTFMLSDEVKYHEGRRVLWFGFLLGQMVKILATLLYRVTAVTGGTAQRGKQRYLDVGSRNNTASGVTDTWPAKTCIACYLLVGGDRSVQDAIACQKCWPAVIDMPDVYKRPCRDYGTSCCAADSPFFKMKQIKGSVLECTSSIRT